MIELLPSILVYSLFCCVLACLAGGLLGWAGYKINFTLGMIASGVIGFILAVQLAFLAFRMSAPDKAWVVLIPLMITTLAFTVANTALFSSFFKYKLGRVIDNAGTLAIESAASEQPFFKLSENVVFATDQSLQGVGNTLTGATLQMYGRNKTRVLACPLIDTQNPQSQSNVWFIRAYSILTPEKEAEADFKEMVKKLKTDFEFFITDDWAYYNINPFPEAFGKKPVFIIGEASPEVKLQETSNYLLWAVVLQNIIFVTLSLALSPIVLSIVEKLKK